MPAEVYRKLCETMARRAGDYPGKDLPEFFELVEFLFTPEEAGISNAIPRGFSPVGAVAAAAGKSEAETADILERMADKGLATAIDIGGTMVYHGPPFVPGIFEYQFMRGTKTDRDRQAARLIHAYKTAYDAVADHVQVKFPFSRTIAVDRVIKGGNQVQTYNQVAAYIENAEDIAIGTCFCRHEAELLDEKDVCGKPNDVCMSFGPGAKFLIDRKISRRADKAQALDALKRSEEAGLVHCTTNRRDIDFLCNCCADHCMIIKGALRQPKPALALNSGFKPVFDAETCTGCETCITICPAQALVMGAEGSPAVDLDRCFGCGVCANLCPSEAVVLDVRSDIAPPPPDRKAFKEALKAANAGA
ncbi:MAG: 4Fe-4S dicluster domain-containing protein [Pseudomonadota bacterium]